MSVPLVKVNGHKVLNYPIIKSVNYYSISKILNLRVVNWEYEDGNINTKRIITKKLSE